LPDVLDDVVALVHFHAALGIDEEGDLGLSSERFELVPERRRPAERNRLGDIGDPFILEKDADLYAIRAIFRVIKLDHLQESK
jgi:hypothetical protein